MYDAIGNQWRAGRQLKRMSTEGKAVSLKYHHNGLRTQKVVAADLLLSAWHAVHSHDTLEAAHRDALHFFYDAQGRPEKVSYNGVIYIYIPSLRGDAVRLLDNSGTLV